MALSNYICIFALAISTVYGEDGDTPKTMEIIGKTIRTMQGEFTFPDEDKSEAMQWDQPLSWRNVDEHTAYECAKKSGGGMTIYHPSYLIDCFKSKTTDSHPTPVYKVDLTESGRSLLSADVTTCSRVTEYIMVMKPLCVTGTVVNQICYKLGSKWTLYSIDKDGRVSLKEDTICNKYTGTPVWNVRSSFHDKTDVVESDTSGSNPVVKVRTVQGELKLVEGETFNANNWQLQKSWEYTREITFQSYRPKERSPKRLERGTLYTLDYRMECYKSRNTDTSSPDYKIKLVGGGRPFLLEADVTTCSRTPENFIVLDPEGKTKRIDQFCFKLQNSWILYTVDEDTTVTLTKDGCTEHKLWKEVP